jgi:ankyrin repeat protein
LIQTHADRSPSESRAGTEEGELPPLPPADRLQELLFDAARIGRDDVIPALLQAGARIEGEDARGYTPLVLASYNKQERTTELLLAFGAKPDGLAEAGGSSALMGVAFKGYVAIARRLLAAGADPNRRNGAGQTALMMAALFGHDDMVDLLIEAGADVAIRAADGNSARDVAAAQGNQRLAERLSAALPH